MSEAVRQNSDQLELILVTPDQAPQRYRSSVTRGQVLRTAGFLRNEVSNPINTRNQRYLAPAQRLHDWLVEPLEALLAEQEITNLVFIMDDGLRTLPVATLHDGEQFIIENYSVGLMPSLRLTETLRAELTPDSQQVLAMGASEFSTQSPLPAVPLELELITQRLWQGPTPILNQGFTTDSLRRNLASPAGIVHLATHAEIQPGSPENSYIQLSDARLPIAQLRQMLLGNISGGAPELMVLSACRTAIENPEAELGFAGLAFGTGINSVLASLWYVSDEGTLALMSEFYHHLDQVNPETQERFNKATALQQAQLAMAKGQVRFEGGQLQSPGLPDGAALPEGLAQRAARDLTHPYYWAAFTMVGNPW